ncbi:MAG: hypothetical protein HKN35_12545 [Woeseia sp.]|nr:hypothetical protein [Woeseia sp.]MBT8095834.1 hypothetical protein [Woeseia sp.]NNE61716.1 hypothetical protein [Woeseia sp.]NNL55088.1 hypothetical protein [Woeseia sp.]
MKYVGALLAGILAGIVLFVLLVYFNPLIKARTVSPIAVTDSRQFELVYTATPDDSILWADNGEVNARLRPPMVAKLVEPAINETKLLVTMLRNSRGKSVGVGIKFETVAEETGVLNGIYPVNSTWHMWLLDRGGMLIDQKENQWSLLRDVVLPAHIGSGDSWQGSWYGILTNGPQSLGTAAVSGGSGSLAGAVGAAIESISARAYSTIRGPVAMEGRITVSLADDR